MKKIFAASMAAIMVFALVSCGNNESETTESETSAVYEEETSYSETTAENNGETETATSAEESESETSASGTEEGSETTAAGKTTTAKATVKGAPTKAADILALYTTVMNKAKNDKVGFTKTEWQELPSDANSRKISKGGTMVNAALNVANNFMTSEEDAKKDPTVYEKGGDMAEFPIRNTPYGCTLKDTGALKVCKCEVLSNGNYKITLVLKDEKNPEPAPAGTGDSPSYHGSVITPVSKNEIDQNLSGGVVSAVCKDISYSLVFHDTSSTVVFNPNTNEIVTLEQITRVSVSGKGKIAGMEIVVDNQELVNTNEIYNLKY